MVYDGCTILDPSGNLLTWCDKKKAKWYLRKGRATLIKEEEGRLTIKLDFQPKGPGVVGNPFYTQPKENKCVVCGALDNLTRHHVVPHCYRRNFPQELKAYCSHDVLPLCHSCHEEYEVHAEKFKKQLFDEANIDTKEVDREAYLSSSAALLLNKSIDIPTHKRESHLSTIKRYLGRKHITESDLASLIKDRPNSYDLLMSRVSDFEGFAKKWRSHFLRYAQPKYLPPYWTEEGRWS